MTTLKDHSSTESSLHDAVAELRLATNALRIDYQALLSLRRLRASEPVSDQVSALLVAEIDEMEATVTTGEARLTLAHIALIKAKREHELAKECRV